MGLIFPTLFVISFIVPGILLQFKLLASDNITEYGRGSDRSAAILDSRNYTQAVQGHTNMKSLERFPDSLSPDIDEYFGPRTRYRRYYDSGKLETGIIYLGSGLGPDSDPDLPLIISRPYLSGGTKMRVIWTIGSEMKEIQDSELGEWIQRSIDARREAENAEEKAD